MTTPPQPVAEIAKQAAEAYDEAFAAWEWNGCRGVRPDVAPFILSAAAKMVQQSGAVEALEEAQELVPTQLYLSPSGELYAAKDACAAALHSLRSITGEAGDSQG